MANINSAGKKLVIASGNKGKIAEIKSILSPFFSEIISQSEAGLDIDVDETGHSFQENALLKAGEVSKLLGLAVIADDSGLCVDCLDGAPGVISARYAGPQHDDEDNRQKLIKECAAFAAPRTARFVSAVALVFPDGKKLLATGGVEGEILLEPRGEGGFGYDCLFYYPPLGKTFAEISFEEKNRISHRRKALMALREHFEGRAE
jgi:XTP/dITP diphosphohydrolase